MSPDDVVDVAVNGVADGDVDDWEALLGRAASAEDRECIACLQLVAQIARVHRSGDLVPDPPPGAAASADGSTAPSDSEERWGKYQLLQEVGAGSFGRVYRAWDPDLEQEIAIKILHSDRAVLPEGRALAKVRDPNVVSVFGVESHGERRGLCMEFVHGETLEDLLQSRGLLNPREAVLVGQDVCRALVAVHRAGFVHRDVKARNIMRDRAGRIVLMDFGTTRDVDELERAGRQFAVAGTPLYMAPELLAGQPATFASDVYSVGVLLYHLVTGKYPVSGRTLAEIRAAHMFATRVSITHRRTDLPDAFIKVIDRALTANPQQRYQSAADLLDDLASVHGATLGDGGWVQKSARASVMMIGTLAGIAVCGAVTSRYVNVALGRSAFIDEGPLVWLRWGFQSLVAPSVICGFVVMALALALVLGRLLCGVSERARGVDEALRGRIREWRLDEVGVLSPCVLVVSALVVAFSWWYFTPLLTAFMIYPDISTAPASQLTLLSPSFHEWHMAYRKTFIGAGIVCLVLWYAPLRLARSKREAINRWVLAGGIAVITLSILMLTFPYRLLYERPVAARWNDARCYVLGERGDEALLFCPQLEPPRSRIVSRREAVMQRVGPSDSLFEQFPSSP